MQREQRGPKGLKKNWKLVDRHLFDEKLENTEQQDKVWNYLKGLSDDPEFNSEVFRIRKKFKLPKDGLSRKSGITKIRKNAHGLDMLIEAEKLANKLDLDIQWSLVIADYIIYNEWKWHFSNWGLIHIDDMLGSLNLINEDQILSLGSTDTATQISYLKQYAQNRPISISISPYVGERNIIDFVKKTYKAYIEPMQKKYRKPGIKIGQFNTRNDIVSKRNNFIFKNRVLGPKKIQDLVKEKFGQFLDTSYISKIIASNKRSGK